jgi:ubiquinone/menaquinone biosynthesis C-methylase UbiE
MEKDQKSNSRDERVCPASHSYILYNKLRYLVHNPYSIIGKYIKEDDTVMDIGCGPGFFSIPIADMVGEKGKVISIDLQKEMLEKLKKNAEKKNLINRITLHQCSSGSLLYNEKVDFVLAFWMVHEVPKKDSFFKQIVEVLKPTSIFMMVEPKAHVSEEKYKEILSIAMNAGLKPFQELKIKFSRGVLFKTA